MLLRCTSSGWRFESAGAAGWGTSAAGSGAAVGAAGSGFSQAMASAAATIADDATRAVTLELSCMDCDSATFRVGNDAGGTLLLAARRGQYLLLTQRGTMARHGAHARRNRADRRRIGQEGGKGGEIWRRPGDRLGALCPRA